MILVFLVLSLIGVFISLAVPGYSDLLLLFGPTALASLLLLLWERKRPADRGKTGRKPSGEARRPARPTDAVAKTYVIIDGSNVMHWGDEGPKLVYVTEVIQQAHERGLTPGVVFDANVGYKLFGSFHDSRRMARILSLPLERVHVVDKGTIADSFILMVARGLKAKVITADRYRDHAETYPEVTEPGWLIRGGVRDGKVWVRWEAAEKVVERFVG